MSEEFSEELLAKYYKAVYESKNFVKATDFIHDREFGLDEDTYPSENFVERVLDTLVERGEIIREFDTIAWHGQVAKYRVLTPIGIAKKRIKNGI